MKYSILTIAALAAFSLSAASAPAQLLYSFEGSADGFGPNGGGVTVSQDTFGATDGTGSLKASVVQGATFVGALTGVVPAALDPNTVTAISFDMSLNPADPQFMGAFDVVGITIFGASQPDYPGGQQFGLQAQFAPLVHVEGLAPGTYHETIALTGATNPLTFDTNQTFADLFGSGPNQLIPTGFEFFINKSNDGPSTIYFDNVAVAPEPTALALGSLGALTLVRRRRS